MPIWCSAGLGAAFSGIHIFAWNWNFPSTTEKILWRFCSLATVVACVAAGISLFILAHLQDKELHSTGPMILAFVALCLTLIIIVQMFACFRRSPAGLYYMVNWSLYPPYFSREKCGNLLYQILIVFKNIVAQACQPETFYSFQSRSRGVALLKVLTWAKVDAI
jgi:lysylphosphatidylglycerol synthetase-like protein (DUF2156 family)